MKEFGPFRLDTVNHCLWRAGERAPLTPKAFDVLRYLVEHAGRLVTPDELLEALWPETYVNPEGIRKYILEVRKALGAQPGQPAFIETLPKRGYQFVAAVTDDSKPIRSDGGTQAPRNIVGRQSGLSALDGYLQNAFNGQRQVVFVTGEAGIGKTTLVDVFQEAARRHSNLRTARGQCIEGFGGIEAYYPMLEALVSLLRDAEDGSLVQILDQRAPTWLVQFPAFVKPERRDSLQREILGSARERMVREICEALEAITAQRPLLVILEDLHWADPATLDLISALARRREAAKLLLIGTYRPVDVVLSKSPLKGLKQDLLVRHLCHEIAVERLEASDVADYLAKIFSVESLPAGLASLIHENSGGNPLFMAAIVQDMRHKGLIAEAEAQLILTVPVQAVYPGIPETLQQLLEIQLEQLSAEEQRILQSSSVAGERFSVWSVAAMLDILPASIEETCDRLASRQQFIRSVGIQNAPNGLRSAHYEFAHSLYRQALHRSLSGVNRSKLHRSLAERLMPICTEGKPEIAAEVALHFEEGRDYKRSIECLLLAATNATTRFSCRDSIGVLRKALDLVDSLGPDSRLGLDVEVLWRIGDAHYALGEMSDSAVAFEAAAKLAAQAGTKISQVAALVRLSVPLWYLDPARGNEVSEQAVEMSRDLGVPLLTAQTQLAAASFRLIYDAWRKQDADICAQAEATLANNGGSGTPSVFGVYVHAFQGNYREAEGQADALLNNTVDPTAHMLASGARGLTFLLRGRLGEVLQTIRTQRERAEKNGEEPWMWLFGEAWLRGLCFDFEGVRRVTEISMRSDTERHAAWSTAVSKVASGYAEIYRGNLEAALQYFADVRDVRITPKFFLHWHWRLHAELGATEAFLHAGEIANARREADGFLRSALSTAEPNMQAHAWDIKSRAASAGNDRDGAVDSLDHALALLDRFEIPLAGWQVHRSAWDLYGQLAEPEKAKMHRARALELIMSIADTFEPGEPLRQSFLTAPPIRRIFEQHTSA